MKEPGARLYSDIFCLRVLFLFFMAASSVFQSRKAEIYFLDEPIGGVDPAARDYILNTIIRNYSEDALVVMSTHLISDIERVLDEAVFINRGSIVFHRSVDEIRETEHKSVDELFREVFRC